MTEIDWRHPNYLPVFHQRAERLARLRDNPERIPQIRAYYRTHIADFINDWGCTYDVRNIEVGIPAVVPFLLFPKQREWVDWVIAHWRARTAGLTDKSRDMGVSWLAVATACGLCLHYDDMSIGFGSRKAELVDRTGDPKSLFHKARMFMELLPQELSGGWNTDRDSKEMVLQFRSTKSTIVGEAGAGIGRGDRKAIYVLDESAFIENPESTDNALSQTTNCRIDISTPNGMANPFAQKRWLTRPADETPPYVLTLHWRDDPRKGEEWYAKQLARPDLTPVAIAQEIDLDYSASVEGVLIPSAWVQAAVDAHIKLGIEVTGIKTGALDVADEGKDKNAFAGGYGILLNVLEEWSGVGSDIFGTVQRAFNICDEHGYSEFKYDSDGLGAGVRGDARVINEQREVYQQRLIAAEPFRGSGAVLWPETEDVEGRKNKDYYLNRKAQGWFSVRKRFQTTYRAISGETDYDPEDIISIDSRLPALVKLTMELSQPTYKQSTSGKMQINKAPEGTRSPNLADALMIWAAPTDRAPMVISDEAVRRTAR